MEIKHNKMKIKPLFALGVIILFLCSPIVAVASDVSPVYIWDNNSDIQQTTKKIVMQKDGSVIIESLTKNGGLLPKGIEIPDSWKNIKINDTGYAISEEEWKFIDSIITDMAPEEKEKFIAELELIFEGTSTLPIEMQQKVISQFGGYLINATEGQSGGPAPLWMENGGHDRMSEADGVNLGYVAENHIYTLMDYSVWADDNRMQPPLPLLVQNRHSWVFNDTPIPFCDNYGPDSLEYFTSEARTNFNNYNTEAAYVSIAKGLH